MNLLTDFPTPNAFLRSAIAGVAIAAPVGLVRLFLGESTAMAAWLGIIAMFIAILHLSPGRQIVIGLWVGVAAGAGALVEGDTLLLGVVIVAGCLMQWQFNQWSTASGALIPPMAFFYWEQAAEEGTVDHPLHIVLATWLGAAIAMAIAAVAKLGGTERPAGRADATWHMVGLAVGCVTLVVLISVFDLPRGFWGILTLCLVYRPTYEETATKVWQRTLGTVIGAVVAVALGIVVSKAVAVAVAMMGGILAVAYILSHDYLRYSVFLTITILLYSAGEPVLDLAEERVGLTVLGAAIAAVLTVPTTRLLRRGATTLQPTGPAGPTG